MRKANPKFNVGQIVVYIDRQGREQTGKVYEVEAKWTLWGHAGTKTDVAPYISYRLHHPTYRNGQFHTSEDNIIRSVGGE
jgi:hypothetical protein